MPAPREFCLVLVKPSHYDDDGYVIQWLRSAIPSNSLAALYGLARDCAERRVLGDLPIAIHSFDETNTRIRPERIARMIEQAGAGMVMLVGVQSNQFPRALDLARPLRARGIQVAIGGFHVSGVLSMLKGVDAGLDEARAMGISLFAGEAEGRLDDVLRDAMAGTLKPLYNYMNDLPAVEGAPIPLITALRAWRTAGGLTSFDAGRGCPFQCSFCTIINVQGRKSRRRSADDVEKIVRENVAQGLHSFFITDDNFARNQDWEPILDRLIHMREVEKIKLTFVIQVDTLCHKIPRFIDKCARAGVKRVFIGLENINPDSLVGAKKRQNRITEYRAMLLAWKAHRVITYAGYILGFPNDTVDSIVHDIEIIKKELPVDILEFFFLTPLPGSEDHQTLVRKGVALDADLNRYDLNHVCTAHPRMSREEWERAYRVAWETYYTREHMTTVLRRIAAMHGKVSNAVFLLTWFKGSIDFEKIHPLEGGFLRLKFRRDRRPGTPLVPAWRFYPQYISETARKLTAFSNLFLDLHKSYRAIRRKNRGLGYMDLALTPPAPDEVETHELYQSVEAQSYISRNRAAVARAD
ncbi:MAG TPA: radical SAM protein [Thermoanaerobaculia bacterium]|nr:radical SAM protein [Thermoanaerobaculia bacterium]